MKVSDYIVKFLSTYGVKDVFMVPGGGCIHIVNSIGENKDINYICNLHEQGAAIAAEAYAQYTGNLGVAVVTTGPGGTNAITGVSSAWLDSVPLMVISGQVQKKDMVGRSGVRQKGFQELDLPDIVRSITKYAITLEDPKMIPYYLNCAYEAAMSGRRGPVWIEVPLDVQNAEMEEIIYAPCCENIQSDFSTEEVELSLNSARRPVLLLGNGVRQYPEKVKKLVKTLMIPTLTTWKAADLLDEKNICYIGRPGIIAQRAANFVQQKADYLLSIGARLDCGQIAFNIENFAPNATISLVDIDKHEVSKFDSLEIEEINCDSGLFMDRLLSQLSTRIPKDHSKWLYEANKLRYKYLLREESKGIPVYDFLYSLSDKMTPNDVFVPASSGMASEIALQTFQVKEGQRLIFSPGLGAMGFGIPASIGACLASGKKRTVCVDGDGSFMMNVQELELIKRLNLPIKIFILNNEGYGSIRNTQDKFFNSKYVGSSTDSGLTLPNFSKIAYSYGIMYRKINLENAESDIEYILKSNKPYICEVKIPKDSRAISRTSSYQKEDGTFDTRPMEDLVPLLDRDELNEIMND